MRGRAFPAFVLIITTVIQLGDCASIQATKGLNNGVDTTLGKIDGLIGQHLAKTPPVTEVEEPTVTCATVAFVCRWLFCDAAPLALNFCVTPAVEPHG